MKHGFICSLILCFASQIANAQFDDKVLVIVNDDVITESEFQGKLYEAKKEIARSGKSIPSDRVSEQVMESMIMNLIQLKEARRRGIRVSDEEVDMVIKGIVKQQGGTIAQLRGFLSNQGISFSSYKENIRVSRIKSKLAQQFASSSVVIADYEIDSFLARQGIKSNEKEYLLAHILLKTPSENEGENSEEENTDELLQQKSQQVQQELLDGMSFKQAVLKYSGAPDAEDGGILGWKKVAQLPKVFADAVEDMEVGDISNVLVSENGLHILQLMNKRNSGKRNTIIQSNVRHILISGADQISKNQAKVRIKKIRARLLAGEDFGKLASAMSDDSVSAAQGGDLGWLSPGETVSQFEKTYEKLKLNEISKPVETRFGVHLIQVLERREHDISEQIDRSKAERVLRAEQSQVQFEQWVRRLRDRAYVQYIQDS